MCSAVSNSCPVSLVMQVNFSCCAWKRPEKDETQQGRGSCGVFHQICDTVGSWVLILKYCYSERSQLWILTVSACKYWMLLRSAPAFLP